VARIALNAARARPLSAMKSNREPDIDTSAAARPTSDANDPLGELVDTLIATRRNYAPRRLVAPGPDASQVARLFAAAAAAPDHGQLTPWRFVVVPVGKRDLLGDVFARALVERDPAASEGDIEAARAKAHNAPLLMLAIARLGGDASDVSDLERMVSLGAAIQNMLLAAHGMGLAAGLAGGRALRSVPLRELFKLCAAEQPVCFVNVGTALAREPERLRPPPEAFVSEL